MHAFHLKTSVDNKKQKNKCFKKVSFFSFVKGVVKKSLNDFAQFDTSWCDLQLCAIS